MLNLKTYRNIIRNFSLFLSFACLSFNVFAQAPNIKYFPSNNIYTLGSAIPQLSPTNTGGEIQPHIYRWINNGDGTPPSSVSSGLNSLVVDRNSNLYFGYHSSLQKYIQPVSYYASQPLFAYNNINGITIDFQGNVYLSNTDYNVINKYDVISKTWSVFAGSGTAGKNNGPAAIASFNHPSGITVDNDGNVYVADEYNNMIRKITPQGVVSTLAGTGVAGSANGSVNTATLNGPSDVAIDYYGNVYVADTKNNEIRKIVPNDIVTTVAGTGNAGNNDGAANTATFNGPSGLVVVSNGDYIYVADYNNGAIRIIGSDGAVSTFRSPDFPGVTDISQYTDLNFNTIKLSMDYNNGILYIASGSSTIPIDVSGYEIDKPLPPGITFNITTGTFTGTPQTVWPPTEYTIIGHNAYGVSKTTVTIEVRVANPNCTYASLSILPLNNITFDKDGNFTPQTVGSNANTAIIFSSDNPAIAVPVNGGTMLHAVAPGTCTITASQTGSPIYCDISTTSTLTIIADQQLLFPAMPDRMLCSSDFSANVQKIPDTSLPDSGIPVIYTSSNTNVATVNNQGVIHVTGTGATTITASRAGNAFYHPGTASQTLNITPSGTPTISIRTPTIALCEGLPITFVADVTNAGANANYQWKVNGTNAGANNIAFVSSSLKTDDQITCTLTNTDCSSAPVASNQIKLSVQKYVNPAVSIAINTPTACQGDNITFTAVPVDGGINPDYRWQVNHVDAGASGSTFSDNQLHENDVVTCVMINHTDMCLALVNASSNPLTVHITPKEVRTVSVTASANSIYSGAAVTFTAVVSNNTGINYQWQINGVDVGENNSQFTTNKLTNGDMVTCTISATGSCVAPKTSMPINMVVTKPVEAKIPNTFTPNGDGVNDTWDIDVLSGYPDCLVNIYDRYGSLVFTSKGYSKPWNGTLNGKPVPTGTYYYVIDLGDINQKLSGSITVIR